MRERPMLPVEVNGTIERRPGVLDVLVCNLIGVNVVSRLRPQLQDGEALVERVGKIPAIVRNAT